MSYDAIYEVVTKLVGSIKPIGSTETDSERQRNLKVMIALVESLIFDIKEVAAMQDAPQHSIRQAGLLAERFLKEATE
jgi:hypothetical protein